MENIVLDKQMAEIALANNAKRLTAIEEAFAALKKEQTDILKMNKTIRTQLNQIGAPKQKAEVQQVVSEQNGYHPNWTKEQKIDFVLKKAFLPLSAKLIIEEVMKLEPASTDRNIMMRGISSVLSVKSNERGKYEKSKNERNENTYQLKDSPINGYVDMVS